ncbi:MAG: MerR family transcriptional regulator [Epulopiscium sp.]|nr:MerR family transcriptional regulator [Candidatus Epulonipiscium sp.]
MDILQYTISEAAQYLEIEAHVLRYWEEELDLEIPRNEWGHRYYTEVELDLFEEIKVLKDQGLQLRAIKAALVNGPIQPQQDFSVIDTDYVAPRPMAEINIGDPNNEKVRQFLQVMKQTFQDALEEHQDHWTQSFKEEFKLEIRQEMGLEFELAFAHQEALEKERFQKVDQTLREVQKMRQEMAAYQNKKRVKKQKDEDFKKGKETKKNKWFQKIVSH